jgi:hypothetical protein
MTQEQEVRHEEAVGTTRGVRVKTSGEHHSGRASERRQQQRLHAAGTLASIALVGTLGRHAHREL